MKILYGKPLEIFKRMLGVVAISISWKKLLIKVQYNKIQKKPLQIS